MEGRAIARPNLAISSGRSPTAELQWRAGQLPGQTSLASCRARPRCGGFNGGPGNCPAKRVRRRRLRPGGLASMEGRAIARPNTGHNTNQTTTIKLQWRAGQLPGQTSVATGSRPPGISCFNGGPGNCPAKRLLRTPTASSTRLLQWRAGQLPGQTGAAYGQRPTLSAGFNGGPGNCPAKPRRSVIRASATSWLQWRAGQLPGQTGQPHIRIGATVVASMEGRAIARPNGRLPQKLAAQLRASMEGRAIARPNAGRAASGAHGAGFNGGPGNCPAKPRARAPGPAPARRFNGGPGNCPAKRWPDATAVAPAQASMEGRAIARPNSPVRARPAGTPQLQWRAGQLPGQT